MSYDLPHLRYFYRLVGTYCRTNTYKKFTSTYISTINVTIYFCRIPASFKKMSTNFTVVFQWKKNSYFHISINFYVKFIVSVEKTLSTIFNWYFWVRLCCSSNYERYRSQRLRWWCHRTRQSSFCPTSVNTFGQTSFCSYYFVWAFPMSISEVKHTSLLALIM